MALLAQPLDFIERKTPPPRNFDWFDFSEVDPVVDSVLMNIEQFLHLDSAQRFLDAVEIHDLCPPLTIRFLARIVIKGGIGLFKYFLWFLVDFSGY